jgi:crossover junction endodeoxyribonuclease RusA
MPWPPTVNNYYTVARNRKILSKRGRQYKKDAWLMILSGKRFARFDGPVAVKIVASPPDKRKRDLDNLLKPILDVLQTASVIVDDSDVVDLSITRDKIVRSGKIEVTVSSVV